MVFTSSAIKTIEYTFEYLKGFISIGTNQKAANFS